MPPRKETEENGWGEYKRLVLKQLEDLTSEVSTLYDKVSDIESSIKKDNREVETNIRKDIKSIEIDIAIIKTKSAMYGALGGGVLAGIVTLIINLLVK